MSSKCKRNICKRKQPREAKKFNNNRIDWGEGEKKFGFEDDKFDYDYKNRDFEYGWKDDEYAKYGEDRKFSRNDKYGSRYGARHKDVEVDNVEKFAKGKNEVHSRRANHFSDVEKRKIDKESEDHYAAHKDAEHQEAVEAREKEHSRKRSKYLVDKLYVYEHHRVIDLDECDDFEAREKARHEFRDLESAVKQFHERDFEAADFDSKRRDDKVAYDASRAHVKALQAKEFESEYDNKYGDKYGHNNAYGYNRGHGGKGYYWDY